VKEGSGLASANYRSLRADKIVETQERLQQRIVKRFPTSGLGEVAGELLAVAKAAAVRAESIRRPNVPLRLAVATLLVAAAVLIVTMSRSLRIHADLREALNLVQFVEAGLGTLVFVGIAVLFLVSLELRWKRRRALAAIHELRAIAHVIDMHQVAKDPEGFRRRGPLLSPSPDPTTRTTFELNRYLSYCNELLAIVSKLAALYVQNFPDPPTLSAVDQIEALCSGLAHKVSQKMLALERVFAEPPTGPTEVPATAPDPAPLAGKP
jgi:hypothetical protein